LGIAIIPFSVYTFGTIDDLVSDAFRASDGLTAMTFNSSGGEAIIAQPLV
jgi:hypothetical protein